MIERGGQCTDRLFKKNYVFERHSDKGKDTHTHTHSIFWFTPVTATPKIGPG